METRDSAEALVAQLHQVVPGLEVIDRRLELGSGMRAEVVGVEDGGRLVLALWPVPEDEDRALLDVLDTLTWARSNRDLLARHLDSERFTAADPLVLVVGDSFSPRYLDRLASIDPGAVRAFERREVTSERGRSTYLVPVGEGASVAAGAEVFLDRLDESLLPRAELLRQRLAHVDDGVICSANEEGLRWSLKGVELCEIVGGGGRLVGRVPQGGPGIALSNEDDQERFLDAALRRYVDLADSVDSLLGEVELIPKTRAPLLSRSEIEALEDPED